eukprot:scaffold2038_cov259-Pinguiococcus_pyrenoidosus.AAC.9
MGGQRTSPVAALPESDQLRPPDGWAFHRFWLACQSIGAGICLDMGSFGRTLGASTAACPAEAVADLPCALAGPA